MKNTKETILSSALQLFNKKGYSNVTIRMIAKDISISPGNLNYHFKNRIEILEALYFQMTAVLENRLDASISKDYDIEVLFEGMLNSMAIMYRYRFIWADLYFLQNESKNIKTHLQQSIQKEVEIWTLLIQKLIHNGYLVAVILKKPNDVFVKRIVDFANTWIFTTALHAKELSDDELVKEQAHYLLLSFYPFFTEKGLQQFEKLQLDRLHY